MENNLRKHLLSNYAAMNDVGMMTKATIDKASAELSDPDEFRIAFKFRQRNKVPSLNKSVPEMILSVF